MIHGELSNKLDDGLLEVNATYNPVPRVIFYNYQIYYLIKL